MIYQICDVRINISLWDRVYFWIYLLNHKSLSHQTWPIDRYKQRQQFSGIFSPIWKTGTKFQVLFNLATCPNYSITSMSRFSVPFFENVNKGQLKMVNVNYWKWPDLAIYLTILIKSLKGPGTSFQSIELSKKHVRNVCHTGH